MIKYSDFEYLLIAIANAYGKDKLLFEERIEWVKQNGKRLMSMADTADDKPLFVRAVMELNRLKEGATTTQFMCGLDATASGIQVLSCMANDITAASHVGLVDPNKRCDAYVSQVNLMNKYLPADRQISLGKDCTAKFTRNDVKKPLMCHFYDSQAIPKEVFGDGSLELAAFYNAVLEMAPGVSELIDDIKGAIRPDALGYSWTMPDGYQVRTLVLKKVDKKVIVDELKNQFGGEATFTHRITVNQPDKAYKAILANVTHSVDSLLLREVERRCNHNKKDLLKVYDICQGCKLTDPNEMVSLREASLMLKGKKDYTENQLAKLAQIIESVIDNPVGPMVGIHDDLKSYPYMMNSIRQYYADVLAEIADSDMTQNILRQLYQQPHLQYVKFDKEPLSKYIRKSNYALC